MSNPSRSLNAALDWQYVLRIFDVRCPMLALPAQAACPICKTGVATVYQDHLAGGQWYSCSDCESAGDMIQLASRAWRLSIEASIVKLTHFGVLLPTDQAAIANNVEQHLRMQERLAGLWQHSLDGLKNPSGELQQLLHRFNLHCQAPPERWRAGPGNLLGGVSTAEVERAFAPGAMQHADSKGQQCNPSAHAVFRGPGWRDTLAIPFFDLPERICAFLFVGRAGEYPSDFVFRRANLGARGNQWHRPEAEAGLALHPLALREAAEWGRTVLALGTPMMALALQMRHFEQSQRPLPLVIWYDSIMDSQLSDRQRVRTTHAWQMLGNIKPVFWMPRFCPSTVQQAVAVDGLISTVGPRRGDVNELQEYLWKFSPRDFVEHALGSAVPWSEALEEAFRQMSGHEAEQALRKLQTYGADISQIFKRCRTALREQIASVFATVGQRSGQLCGGPLIIERAGKWYARVGRSGQETLVADAVLRIDRILNHRQERQTYVRGRIIYQNWVVRFCERMERLERKGLLWMRDELARRGVGFMTYNPTYQRRLTAMAQLFHEPVIASAVHRVGWNEHELQFVLPSFTIGAGGIVGTPENAIFPRGAPASCLQSPENLTPEELDRGAGADYSARLFWATLGSVLANIVAPACHAVPTGIGLVGAGAQAMAEVLTDALGCWHIDVANAKDLRRARAAEHAHSWPVYVRPADRLQRRTLRLLLHGDSKPRNMITPVETEDVHDLAIEQQWHVVCGEEPMACSDRLRSYARRFVPAYLKHFCRNRLSVDHWNKPLNSHVQEVLRDIGRFIAGQEGDADAVMTAADLLVISAKSPA